MDTIQVDQSEQAAKVKRSETRKEIHAAHIMLQTGTYDEDENITMEQCTKWAQVLAEVDSTYGGDNLSKSYITKLKEIVTQLKEDKQQANQQTLPLPPIQSVVPQVNQIYYRNDSDSKIQPFDGQACHYRQFEKLFECKYELDPAYKEADRFLIFRNLIGDKGRELILDLDPTTAGLTEAKRRMREQFDDPYRIREDIRKRIQKLPRITDRQQVSALKTMIITCEEALKILKDCGSSKEYINESFFRLITSKLPFELVAEYAEQYNTVQDTRNLLDHLADKVKCLAIANEMTGAPQTNNSHHSTRINVFTSAVSQNNNNNTCSICTLSHRTIFCNSYDAAARKNIATSYPLCFRCLDPNHSIASCSSSYRCPCGGDHSRVICLNAGQPQPQQSVPSRQPPAANTRLNQVRSQPRPNQRSSTANHVNTRVNTNQPLRNANNLQSAMQNVPQNNTVNSAHHQQQRVNMAVIDQQPDEVGASFTTKDECVDSNYRCPFITSTTETKLLPNLKTYYQTCLVKVNDHIVRIVLDSCGGRTVMEESLCDQLKLETYAMQNLKFGGPFGISSKATSKRIVCATIQSLVNDQSCTMFVNVVPSLGPLRMAAIPSEAKEKLKQKGYQLVDADEQNFDDYPVRMIVGLDYYGSLWKGSDIPITKDLYVRESVFGWVAFGVTAANDEEAFEHINIICVDDTENCALQPTKSTVELNAKIEAEYLQEFIASKVARRGGTYSVNLPYLNPVNLADNKEIAWNRFLKLLKQLRIRGLFSQYSEVMNEMITKFAERITTSATKWLEYYMPHHCVLRLDKSTTQIRVVFDGSSHAAGALSLNDNLFKGVNQWDSFEVFIRFRLGPTAVCADIEKAYLMIEIAPEDRDVLRFFWLDEYGNPCVYRMKVVPFGTSASPFLLFAVMKNHFDLFRSKFPETIKQIENNFYVDDLLLALQTSDQQEIQSLKEQVIELFSFANMNIRKWRSNVPELDRLWEPGGKDQIKVLGHFWNVRTDVLSIAVDIARVILSNKLTKRIFASFLSSIYDLSGSLSPYLVGLRLFVRKLWQQRLKWDDQIPDELLEEAHQLIKDGQFVNVPTIPRNIIIDEDCTNLLVFCDASPKAVGVVVYTQTATGTRFVLSKAKLAREASIPELELDALFMAAELARKLSSIYTFSSVTIYSDSLPNLQRLLKHPNSQKPAVAIRIATLKTMITANYRHVESKDNVADIITRGCSMTQLLKNERWWKGPPISEQTKFDQTIIAAVISAPEPDHEPAVDTCTKFSSYGIAINTFRRVAKFIQRTSKRAQYQELNEDQLALVLLIKTTQRQHFATEIGNIEANKQVEKSSVLRNYNVFLDSNGLLRLRTRLEKAITLTYDQKCPVLMPSHCHISRLIVLNEHARVMHAGVERTIEAVRNRYFIIRVKDLAKNVRKKCRLCKWLLSNTPKVNFGALPSFRLNEAEPSFTNTGLDIFGPLKIRMKTPGKRYGLIFTCATTRAVHLEIMNDMTADQVLWAIRRFIGRRGIPNLIYSDNGPQLVAVKKRMATFLEEIRRAKPNFEIRITWLLQTAISPWRGGFYERLIRTVKYSLLTLTFKRPIDDTELSTIIIEVESHLNGRPLFVFKGEVITPSHFFAGKALTRLPPLGNNDAREITRVDIIDKYISNQRLVNSIWTVWRTQYMLQLRQYHQNVNTTRSPFRYSVGDVVLLKNEKPIDEWPMGTVVRLYESPDGIVRSVDVRTAKETKPRSIQTIIPLECQFDREPSV